MRTILLFDLNAWWQSLSSAHQVFWFIAVIFSVLFFIQFVLVLIGFDTHDGELEFQGEEAGFDHEFSALSVRSIIAFFTFFGWAGVLALNRPVPLWLAAILATMAGLAAMFLVAYLMFKFSQLEQSGTLNLYKAIDQEGEVYLSIPPAQEGMGKIHLMVDGRIRELDAITDGNSIKTGTPVRVKEILKDNVLRVEVILPRE